MRKGVSEKRAGVGKVNDPWDRMYEALVAFRRKHGHCGVPTVWPRNVQLGRWVATQRHRRKINRLTPAQIRRLTKIGFAWSPTDDAWNEMLRALAAFKKKHGHCNVPSHWGASPNLASWVANERHRKRMGMLSRERVKDLDALGFTWRIYGCGQETARKEEERPVVVSEQPVEEAPSGPEERLYNLGRGAYVQYSSKGRKPQELVRYLASHNDEWPPYIPLPRRRTVLHLLGDSYGRGARKVIWKGYGRLPKEVVDYVSENGVLPPHC